MKFAIAMDDKLNLNQHKGGWHNESSDYLLSRLKDEVVELEDAIKNGEPEHIASETTDVANFAMMLFDILGQGK